MSANRWVGISDQAAGQIEAALARGHKIEAIRIYREATNCGLKEAKDAVEAAERETVGAGPGRGGNDSRRKVVKASAARPGPSWLTTVLVLIVVGVVLAVVLLLAR